MSCGGKEFDTVQMGRSVSPSPNSDRLEDRPSFWASERLPLRVLYRNIWSNKDDYHHFEDAMRQWDNSIPSETFFDFNYSEDSQDFEGTVIQVSVKSFSDASSSESYPDLNSDALAITDRRFMRFDDLFLLVAGRIVFNTDHAFSFEPTPFFDEPVYDLKGTFLHEIGHLLGLEHPCSSNISCPNTVMKPQLPPFVYERDLFPRDRSAIRALYQKRDELLLKEENHFFSLRPEPGRIERETLSLYPDGSCIHRQNGLIVHKHKIPLRQIGILQHEGNKK